MHESDTYQAILDEGAEMVLREMILLQGEDLFGPPGEAEREQLRNVTDLDRLRRMLRRTPKAAGWQDILETP